MRKLRYLLLLPLMYITIGVIAQETQADSLLKADKKKNSEYLSNLKSKKTDTEATAKEARRIEKNANSAATESRKAYRMERKAQQARKNANRQAKKAKRSQDKSDG